MIIIAYGSNKFSLDHFLKTKSEWDWLIKKKTGYFIMGL
jgi:hypothetical protein